jgi:diguanylate cyclase (GGDEF)-like protein/PAS domain S-box-containing protein
MMVAMNPALTSSADEAVISAESFKQAFDQAPIGMALVSPDGKFLRVNQALAELAGYSRAQLLEMDFQQITHPDDLDLDLAYVREVLAGERRSYMMEKRYIHATGDVVWALLNVSLLRDEHGEPQHFVSQIQDITERKALERRLMYLAGHDEMTGLRNRRRFDEDLADQVQYARRYGHSAALLLIDLDSFKDVNDTFGHAAGDELVKAVATRIGARLRRTDLVGRIGGDEFAIFLPEADRVHVEHVATVLGREIAGDPVVVEGRPLWSRASIGIALFDPEAPVDAEQLLIRADRAMYEAKGSGGNRYAVATPR